MAAATTTPIEPPLRAARLIVDLDAVVANWRLMAEQAGAAECAAVVKADAYGLGVAPVAKALAGAGARTFFVATLGEGLSLRAALGAGPAIYVLNGFDGAAEPWVGADLRPVLNTLEQAQAWRAAGGGACALHIDTGMNRLGVGCAGASAAAEALAGVDVRLVMSHLACAASPAHPLNAIQRARFLEAAQAFPGVARSLAASAGTLLGANYAFDLVRPGIALYGGSPLDQGGPTLAAAATLLAPILQVRDVPAGEAVGYGAAFIAARALRVAVIAAGYADGVLRAASSRGYGVLGGHRCALIGRISMDLATIDVTAAGAAAQPGAAVELFGPRAPIDALARAAGTIVYELLTSMRGAARTYTGRCA